MELIIGERIMSIKHFTIINYVYSCMRACGDWCVSVAAKGSRVRSLTCVR